jgi:hypothetical protein
MYRKAMTMVCGLIVILAVVGCGAPQSGSDEVAEAMKRISAGMEAQRIESWAPADVSVLLDSPVATGETLQVRLSDLQLQSQQPPARAALRMIGEMQITNQRADAGVTLIYYETDFLSSDGEALPVDPDESSPLVEEIEPGQEITTQFEALLPTTGEELEDIEPDAAIEELVIRIVYAIDGTQETDILTFPLAFQAQ